MARISRIPSYPDQPDRQGRTRIKIKGVSYSLGKHGSTESLKEYARIIAEHAGGEMPAPRIADPKSITVAELVALWGDSFACELTDEDRQVKATALMLVGVFGNTLAAEFTAKRLEALRDSIIKAGKKRDGAPICRGYANRIIRRVVRVFRWAEKENHVPRGTWDHLRSLEPLGGRDKRVSKSRPRQSVDWDTQIAPALPYMPAQVRSIVRVQLFAGMRPQDACRMRVKEIDRDGPHGCWVYRPEKHKNDWREGAELLKVLGPQSQAAIAPWIALADGDDAYLFPPLARKRAKHVTVDVYARAVRAACKLAKVKPWVPADLRHTAAQTARRLEGAQGVKALLGHDSIDTGKHYAKEIDLELAAKIAKQVG